MKALALRRQPRPETAALMASFLSGRSPQTLAAYGADLRDFTDYLRRGWHQGTRRLFVAADTEHTTLLDAFLGLDGPAANLTVLDYRNDLGVRGKAPGTVNRRLAAMRSFTKLARMGATARPAQRSCWRLGQKTPV